jgi:hypothetical protein
MNSNRVLFFGSAAIFSEDILLKSFRLESFMMKKKQYKNLWFLPMLFDLYGWVHHVTRG